MFLWQIAAARYNTCRVLISSPELVAQYFWDNFADLLKASWTTFYESFIGLVMAIAISFGVMILCLYRGKLLGYVLPVMVFSQVIPLITLAPLFIVLFGIGPTAKVAMSCLICFFPIFINFANGIKQVPTNILELLFINNATRWQTIRFVYFPLCLPFIFSGLKVAATLSVIGAIIGEFSGAEVGLGRNLFITALRLEPELMMTSIILSGLLGGVMFGSIHLLELKFGKWYLRKA